METSIAVWNNADEVESYWTVNDCQFDEDGTPAGHQYASVICGCGSEFCWACAGETNLHIANTERRVLRCPSCGENFYDEA